MVCFVVEPRVAGLKARTNPLSYGGTPRRFLIYMPLFRFTNKKKA